MQKAFILHSGSGVRGILVCNAFVRWQSSDDVAVPGKSRWWQEVPLQRSFKMGSWVIPPYRAVPKRLL